MAISNYQGEYSIDFWRIDTSSGVEYSPLNSWLHLHLIPVERPKIDTGSANFTINQIPNTDWQIDVTDYGGGLTFEGRTGSWSFIIDQDYYNDWLEAYEALCDYFHGGYFAISFFDNPERIYLGTITVSGYSMSNKYSVLTLSYDITPTLILNEPGPFDEDDHPLEYVYINDLLFRIRFFDTDDSLITENLYGYNVSIPDPMPDPDHSHYTWEPPLEQAACNRDYHLRKLSTEGGS